MSREKLPWRRPSEQFEFAHDGVVYLPAGRLGEIFLNGHKIGSGTDIAARDSAITTSIALQHGCPPESLASACTRDANGLPEGLLGVLFDRLSGPGA